MLALCIKGETSRKYGRLQEAVQTVRHALDIAPDDVASLNILAHAYRPLSSYEELLPITTRLVKLTPDSRFAWDSHTSALRGLGQFDAAIEAIEHVLELDPANVR